VALSFTCSPPEVVDVVGDQPNIPITVGQMMDAAPSSPAAGGHQRLKHEADAVVERGSLRPPRVQITGYGQYWSESDARRFAYAQSPRSPLLMHMTSASSWCDVR
jgi:hypothetical protein